LKNQTIRKWNDKNLKAPNSLIIKRWIIILLVITGAFFYVEFFIVNDIRDPYYNPLRIALNRLTAPRITESNEYKRPLQVIWADKQNQAWKRRLDILKATLGNDDAAARLSQAYCSGDRQGLTQAQLLPLWRKSALRGFLRRNKTADLYPLIPCLADRSKVPEQLLLRTAGAVRVLIPLTFEEASVKCQQIFPYGHILTQSEWNSLDKDPLRLGEVCLSYAPPWGDDSGGVFSTERFRCQALDSFWAKDISGRPVLMNIWTGTPEAPVIVFAKVPNKLGIAICVQ
jgi:hypothetical protein